MAGDPNETVKSVADATKSLSDTVRLSIDVTGKAVAWLALMFGEDAAGILKDRLYYWRATNALTLQARLDHLLKQYNIENPKAIPLRLLIPFLEAATLEDDDTLQERWARLLANAMDPSYTGSIERCFGQVLEGFSAVDCLVLEQVAVRMQRQDSDINFISLANDLRIEQNVVSVTLGNLRRLGLLHNLFFSDGPRLDGKEVVHHELTDFGGAFLAACTEPRDVGERKMNLKGLGHGR